MSATSKPVREWDRVIVRLPDGMKAELEEQAALNCRPLNGEIVFLLRQGIATKKASNHPA
jgi:hypothetical protein